MSLPPLSADQLIKPQRFELRISLMFGALFIPMGVHLPYFPLWLESLGFDAAEIAVVLSAPLFLRVFCTPLITAFADRVNDRAHVLIAMTAASFLLSLGYFATSSFMGVLLVSLLLVVVWTPQSPLTDSLALSGVRRFGSNYAGMRIWGSAAFLAANLIGGFVVSAAGESSVPGMVALGLAAALAASLMIPRLGRPRVASPLSAYALQEAGPSLTHPHFLLCVAGAGIINGSHGFMYGFASIYWKSLDLDESVIGILWTAAVVAEVCIFMVFNRILGGSTSSFILALAGAGALLRWLAYPLVWPWGAGIAGFLVIQALHAVSTGLVLLGVQKLIAETIGEEKTGAAQGVAFFANGLSMALVTLASGALYEKFRSGGFYVMAGVAVLGIALIAGAWLLAPERRLGRPHQRA